MASKRHLRRKQCSQKDRHATIGGANMARKMVFEKKGVSGLHAYRCPFCKGYHIGHQPFAAKPRTRRKEFVENF